MRQRRSLRAAARVPGPTTARAASAKAAAPARAPWRGSARCRLARGAEPGDRDQCASIQATPSASVTSEATRVPVKDRGGAVGPTQDAGEDAGADAGGRGAERQPRSRRRHERHGDRARCRTRAPSRRRLPAPTPRERSSAARSCASEPRRGVRVQCTVDRAAELRRNGRGGRSRAGDRGADSAARSRRPWRPRSGLAPGAFIQRQRQPLEVGRRARGRPRACSGPCTRRFR